MGVTMVLMSSSVMVADMWWRIWTRIGGEYVVVVYGSDDEVGLLVTPKSPGYV